MNLSYKKQSIALNCKSIDWFLDEGNMDLKWVYLGGNIRENTQRELNPLIPEGTKKVTHT